jgi:hypothetical protein
MFRNRAERTPLAVLIVGAITGGVAGFLLGGFAGAGIGAYVATVEDGNYVYHMATVALTLGAVGDCMGHVFGALLWRYTWMRHGRPPRLEELGLTRVWGRDGLLARAVRGTIAGTLFAIPVGLLFAAVAVGASLGKRYGGQVGAVLGTEGAGALGGAVLLAVLAIPFGARHPHRFPGPGSRRHGRPPGPLAHAVRGGRSGAVVGLLIGFTYVLPALAGDPDQLLTLGMKMAAGMAVGVALVGVIFSTIRDIMASLDRLPQEPVPPLAPWGSHDLE